MGAVLLWATTVALARSLSEQVGAVTAGATTYLVGALTLFLSQAALRGTRAGYQVSPGRYLYGCGALFVLYTALLFLAIGLAKSREEVLEVGLVNYFWPVFTVLLSLPLLRLKARPWLWPSAGLALYGTWLVLSGNRAGSWSGFVQHLSLNPIPYALALGAAVTWALYSNLTRRWAGHHEKGAALAFVTATGLFLLLCRIFVSETGEWTTRAMVEALALGVVTGAAYSLWDQAMRRGDHSAVTAFSYLTPLLSTLLSCMYLQVRPEPRLWMGCGLLVAGSWLSWLSMPRAAAAKPD